MLSLANGVVGVLHPAALAIHAIGQAYAKVANIQPKSGVKQVDRLPSNAGLDMHDWAPANGRDDAPQRGRHGRAREGAGRGRRPRAQDEGAVVPGHDALDTQGVRSRQALRMVAFDRIVREQAVLHEVLGIIRGDASGFRYEAGVRPHSRAKVK